MALPSYATPVQRTYYYAYLLICSLVFFFLIAPLVAIIPISFSQSPFMVFTEGMMSWPPDGWLVEDVKKKETDQMSLFKWNAY